MKIYVGCALTEASEDFKKMVAEFKLRLKTESLEVLEFIGLVDGTPTDVYRHDIFDCVGNADLMIAICDQPSTGLGYELCEALRVRNIPVLGVAKEGARVTRLVLGIDHPKFSFERYVSDDDLLRLARTKIAACQLQAHAA